MSTLPERPQVRPPETWLYPQPRTRTEKGPRE